MVIFGSGSERHQSLYVGVDLAASDLVAARLGEVGASKA